MPPPTGEIEMHAHALTHLRTRAPFQLAAGSMVPRTEQLLPTSTTRRALRDRRDRGPPNIAPRRIISVAVLLLGLALARMRTDRARTFRFQCCSVATVAGGVRTRRACTLILGRELHRIASIPDWHAGRAAVQGSHGVRGAHGTHGVLGRRRERRKRARRKVRRSVARTEGRSLRRRRGEGGDDVCIGVRWSAGAIQGVRFARRRARARARPRSLLVCMPRLPSASHPPSP